MFSIFSRRQRPPPDQKTHARFERRAAKIADRLTSIGTYGTRSPRQNLIDWIVEAQQATAADARQQQDKADE